MKISRVSSRLPQLLIRGSRGRRRINDGSGYWQPPYLSAKISAKALVPGASLAYVQIALSWHSLARTAKFQKLYNIFKNLGGLYEIPSAP